LQQTASDSGANLIGDPAGLNEALHSGRIARWDADAPLLLENPIWLALLCAAPLQNVWSRELRASNLAFLRKLLPMSWAVDPSPLPHQAVIPRLGVRSFAEVTDANRSDLVLRSFLKTDSGPSEVIRSQVTNSAWASAMDGALAEFETAPWLLQERPAFTIAPPGNQVLGLGSGEPQLRAYYFEQEGQVSTGGIVARFQGNDEGETGVKLSLLAPCGVASDF
jgi:hypothetical protein